MSGFVPRSWSLAVALCLVVYGLGGGCGFLTLRKYLQEASNRAPEPAMVQGSVADRATGGGPFVVVVYSLAAGRVTNLLVLPRGGPFFFALPVGTYRVAAFEDLDHDLAYQPETEPAAVFGDPSELVLGPGERRSGLDLAIDASSNERIPFEVATISTDQEESAPVIDLQLATIVTLDDPRFSDGSGRLGLWNPLEFLASVGAGVYFLEEYDPDKIPVLFVHGVLGHPGNWRYLVSTLDRSRFQPWLVYYPSASHLDRIARAIVRALGALRTRYDFSRLIVVAHSMGGLVGRSAINYAIEGFEGARAVDFPAFVTISSPWNGHSAAAAGVSRAPVVAPSWRDMAPNSAFLQGLPRTALPPECEFSLLFSYRGSSMRREANDGTVTVASQLSMPIQLQAARVTGFDESHTSILRSPSVAAQLNAILLRAAGTPSSPNRDASAGA